jgi:thymidylate kinase
MFIVIEGIDGAGKGRQRLELIEHLQSRGIKNIDGTEFPDHQGLLYKNLIKPYLLSEIKIPKSALFLSFALDQILFESRINKAKASKPHHFISDGYFTTNLVYNCLVDKYLPLNKALKFASDFKIPVPDLNIFIDVEPEIALARKSKESGHEKGLDINEKDIKKQYSIRKGFLKLVNDKVFGKWVIVDGRGNIEQVKNEITGRLNDLGLFKI